MASVPFKLFAGTPSMNRRRARGFRGTLSEGLVLFITQAIVLSILTDSKSCNVSESAFLKKAHENASPENMLPRKDVCYHVIEAKPPIEIT